MLLRPLRVANNTPHERTPAQWLRVQFCTVESWAKHKYWDRTQHTTNFHANNHLHGPGVLTLVRVPVCPNRLTDQTWNATTRQDDFALSTDQCRQSAVFTQLLLWTHIYIWLLYAICHIAYAIWHTYAYNAIHAFTTYAMSYESSCTLLMVWHNKHISAVWNWKVSEIPKLDCLCWLADG